MVSYLPSLVTVILFLGSTKSAVASVGWQDVLQNDLLAALSWAMLGIDPHEYTEGLGREMGDISENETMSHNITTPEDIAPSSQHYSTTDEIRDIAVPRRVKRQLFTFQGDRPRLRCELRPISWKSFEIHDGTFFSLFLGISATSNFDDLLNIAQRGQKSNLLSSIEDIINMLGVDGAACMHRLLCDLGASPGVQSSGIFGELLDVTVRYILKTEYQHIVTNGIPDIKVTNTSSGITYLDAVSTGLHGANCAHVFSSCPISLVQAFDFMRDRT